MYAPPASINELPLKEVDGDFIGLWEDGLTTMRE
jgi:hypothetical protein